MITQKIILVGDVLGELELTDPEKKKLIDKVAKAMEKRIMDDATKMLYGSGAVPKWIDWPEKTASRGRIFGLCIDNTVA